MTKTDHTETAQQMLDMAENGQKQKARYWLANIKIRHSRAHYQGLIKRIKELQSENKEN